MIEIVGASGCISYDGVNNLQTTLLVSINYFNDIFVIFYWIRLQLQKMYSLFQNNKSIKNKNYS